MEAKSEGRTGDSKERIKKITNLYYSNKKVQEKILDFANGREVVPRYFESFGKRPDTLVYPSDIIGLVKKGATSFHASEEIWEDPLQINSDWNRGEMNDARKSWDLVIDIDSKYLDLSRLLARLILKTFDEFGIRYGIKFSGNKGFHIIVSGKAFPEEYNGQLTRDMFPEWPRAMCEYIMSYVRREYNRKAKEVMGKVETIKSRTNLSEKDFMKSVCPNCGGPAKKGVLITLECPVCKFNIKRKDMKITNRKLICPQNNCGGLEIVDKEDYFQCENCNNLSSINKRETSGRYSDTYTKDASRAENFEEEMSGEVFGSSDLILVAPRHLFRMPYSLHEKTALASIVLEKEEIEGFDPLRDADPLRAKIKDFLPINKSNEALKLLSYALDWKKGNENEKEKVERKNYKEYEKISVKGVSEDMFPKPIKKLLKGLKDGKKRGLFVLLTFLRTLNFSPEYINVKIREWNKLNEPPLKEGYVKGQIEWHLKQRKQIMPPNYANDNFYKDLGLLEDMPRAKNPISEVLYKFKKSSIYP